MAAIGFLTLSIPYPLNSDILNASSFQPPSYLLASLYLWLYGHSVLSKISYHVTVTLNKCGMVWYTRV